ncbi:uncharacterized protein METZ01_LOCUS451394 [marine metagenome]|uniref:Uncharacterized protein n=1 Tax=marine metagenome TaxID=408172 RepID=A0A382ZTD1_9ZZZZ
MAIDYIFPDLILDPYFPIQAVDDAFGILNL